VKKAGKSMRYILAIVALAGVAACDTPPPSTNTGVGFGDYEQYQTEKARRTAQLESAALPSPDAVSGEALRPGLEPAEQPPIVAQVEVPPQPQVQVQPEPVPETDLAAATQTALSGASQGAGAATLDNPGISDENDFEAVGSRRSIESDAARIARNKEKYKVAQTQALPRRSGGTGPNIVDYALRSKHPVGTQIYSRLKIASEARFKRNCSKFASPDLAQIQFLAKGGPQRDRQGLDPDGDGFACAWDPTPFRKAAGG
jgi:hypothetical protein